MIKQIAIFSECHISKLQERINKFLQLELMESINIISVTQSESCDAAGASSFTISILYESLERR